MPPEVTHLSLIEDLKRVDNERAWTDFVDIYGRLISQWLGSQGIQFSDAEDIKQEVLSVVIKEISSFQHNGRPGAFRRWLRLIMSNRLRRLWESKSSEEKRLSDVNLSDIADQVEKDDSRLSAIWNQEHNAFVLHEMLDLLRPSFEAKSIEAFRRLAIEGQSVDSVASDLGMTIGAVRVAQHRVLKALKDRASALID